MMNVNMQDLKYQAVGLPDEVRMYHYAGDFAGELSCIDRWLARQVPDCLRKRLELQKLFAAQLLDDYPLGDDDMVAGLKERFPAADLSTLEALIAKGNVDYILRSGRRCYQQQALSNMLMIHGDFLMSLADPTFRAPDRSREGLETIHRMQAAGGCAYRYEVEEQIRLVPHAERPGEMLRLWFPFPVACATQPESEIHLLGSSHPVRLTGTVHRTAFMEVPCEPGATYSVRFSFVNRAKYTDLSHHTPTGIPAGEGLTPEELERWTGEQYPHIRFTPLIDGLAEEIRGSETDPLRLARRVYDWICAHVQYSYVRDYLLIDNIPEFVLTNGYGDCGTMALAFITLCRRLGIPPSGSPAVPAHPTASVATTGACSTLRPMAGCTATRPTVSVRSGRATRSGASTISAILTRSGLSHRMSSSRRRNLPRRSVAWIHTTIRTARESMPTAYTTSFSVIAHTKGTSCLRRSFLSDIRAAETKKRRRVAHRADQDKRGDSHGCCIQRAERPPARSRDRNGRLCPRHSGCRER